MRKMTESEALESILGPSYDVQEKIDETREKVKMHATAKQALKRLTAVGISESRILEALFLYCGPSSTVTVRSKKEKKEMDAGLHAARKFNKRVGELAKALSGLAKEVDLVLSALREVGALDFHTPVASDMRQLAKLLEIQYLGFRQGRPAKSGRNHHLFYLAKLVELATGELQYGELSPLVSAVGNDPEGSYGCSPEGLSRKITRFEKDHPFEGSLLSEMASADLIEWKATASQK